MSFPAATAARMVVRCGEWAGVDHGGPYIDIYHATKPNALDVINVWDYAAGARSVDVPWERKAVRKALLRWIVESGDDFLRELPYL